MGFGPFSSESTTKSTTSLSNRQVTGDNQAVVYAPTVSASAGKGGSNTVIGPDGTLIKLAGNSALSLDYTSDPDLLKSAIDSVTNQSDQFSRSLTGIFAAASDAQSALAIGNAVSQKNLLEQTFSKLADLAKSSQSGGETDRNQIVLYVSLAALAVVGSAFFFRK